MMRRLYWNELHGEVTHTERGLHEEGTTRRRDCTGRGLQEEGAHTEKGYTKKSHIRKGLLEKGTKRRGDTNGGYYIYDFS